jgi:hypothetical protein
LLREETGLRDRSRADPVLVRQLPLALPPELEPALQALVLRLQDLGVRLRDLAMHRPLGKVFRTLARCPQQPLLEGEQLRINLHPVGGVFDEPGLGVLAVQKPLRIFRVAAGIAGLLVALDGMKFRFRLRRRPESRPSCRRA